MLMQGLSQWPYRVSSASKKVQKTLLEISGDRTWDRTFFVLCAYTKHALNVIECRCHVMIGHTISMHCLGFYLLFSLSSQKELKYRHEVVSVEQINKKIGIQ